ncbi:MAG TPA: 2-C-methyl-D-erythritol 4-phosphate cytidylyltransferase [bacterium]|nr:2-C-methyl-D-erythritol 4-phosphate cytidylyltransferase [bacterium]
MSEEKGIGAVIVAGGTGSRMGGEEEKLFIDLGGIPILALTLRSFQKCPEIERIVLAVSSRVAAGLEEKIFSIVGRRKISAVVPGGPRRQDSVLNGLGAFAPPPASVLVHDGDRPFVSPELIGTVSRRARKEPVILALRARDTIKLSDGRRIERTLDRDRIWQAQTPQGFPFGPFYRAHLRARAEGWEVTDDASIMEKAGFEVGIVEGTPENIKITAPCDREIARAIFRTMPS